MSDLDREYRVLGLENNASLDEIEEAYQDLKSVWHPDRFSDSPKLRAKAEEKQRAVELAYQILREDHSRERIVPEAVTKPSVRGDEESVRGPSILDDTLSERIGKSKQRFPLWSVFFGLVAIAVVISFLTWSPVDVESEPEPSTTEKILADSRQGGSADKESSEEENLASTESPEVPDELPAASQPSTPTATISPELSVEQLPTQPPPRLSRSENSMPASKPPLKRKPVPVEPIPDPVKDNDAPEGEPVLEEPAISELAERSFQILRAKSDLANQLVEGSFGEFNYKDWKAVERSATEVYVDLIVDVVSEDREVHFVWAVDVEAQSVKPMSQAARDLQAEER